MATPRLKSAVQTTGGQSGPSCTRLKPAMLTSGVSSCSHSDSRDGALPVGAPSAASSGSLPTVAAAATDRRRCCRRPAMPAQRRPALANGTICCRDAAMWAPATVAQHKALAAITGRLHDAFLLLAALLQSNSV